MQFVVRERKRTSLLVGFLRSLFTWFEFDSFQIASWIVFYDSIFFVCVMKTDSYQVRGLSPADFDFICWGVLTLSNLPVGLIFVYDSIFLVCVCHENR